MKEVTVHFYEDILSCYCTKVIEAESEKDFEEKLNEQIDIVQEMAAEENVEIEGARYDLPDSWD